VAVNESTFASKASVSVNMIWMSLTTLLTPPPCRRSMGEAETRVKANKAATLVVKSILKFGPCSWYEGIRDVVGTRADLDSEQSETVGIEML